MDHGTVDQNLDYLIAIILSAGVSRTQVEAKRVKSRREAFNYLPRRRAWTLQRKCSAERQSIERRRKEGRTRPGQSAGARSGAGDTGYGPSEARSRIEVLKRPNHPEGAAVDLPLVCVTLTTQNGYGAEVKIDNCWLLRETIERWKDNYGE
jgi:hypothetical protein